ncbi:MAG: GNAT family N-acetyltransferase [Flavobacteriaceae bacterium]
MEICIAHSKHIKHARSISEEIDNSAKVRGTGIARRTPEYIASKMEKREAIIALKDGQVAGFCYLEVWGQGQYLAHSGLIVFPDYRGQGLAKRIKKKTLDYSQKLYPKAKIFGITTGKAVMKINSDLGYKPVHFSELTDDLAFWNGCQSCKNYDVLIRTERSMCLCTGMLYEAPQKKTQTKKTKWKQLFSATKKSKP